ncbi:PTS sugar transporter subunit IIA [candidate division KSB1 bacterium]|nr:PTS sugar transporter subunit IIA [candidate division KSB1 bacterium]NIS24836.1 PTS sugar transporter subunit IIA [candidate division KSB1 bacterium]NIT71756.1 PTS sugar transporter subunit IIA [candidate division KSB1 bacterium]NIU25471.1 PTS sugar transporter subunit IIA [candidate division KSB1 bacterium]NIU92448.1 PTS transporter subunit EIIA [candidate division KSB1 bacterium]
MKRADLIHYFSEDLFIPNLKSKTKEDTFAEFANRFVKSKIIRKKNLVLELLKKRETLGSTGIGKGVAIPHGRTTAVLEVKIAFGKSGEGMDFEAVDKKPVHLIFMVMAPPHDENNRYLPILGKLVELLSDSKFRKQLLKVERYDEFVEVFKGGK